MKKKQAVKSDYHHENLKDALIDTALSMLDETGLESITLRELTSRLGASRTAVYRHFDSKEHLFQAVILKGFNKLDEVLKPVLLDRSKDVKQQLYAMGKAYIDFALQNKPLYRIMLGNQFENERENNCVLDQAPVNTGFDALIALIVEAQEKGIFRKADAQVQATTIWAMVHGQASLFIDGHPIMQNNKDAVYKESYKVLIEGFVILK